jgi:hypothetical protein
VLSLFNQVGCIHHGSIDVGRVLDGRWGNCLLDGDCLEVWRGNWDQSLLRATEQDVEATSYGGKRGRNRMDKGQSARENLSGGRRGNLRERSAVTQTLPKKPSLQMKCQVSGVCVGGCQW